MTNFCVMMWAMASGDAKLPGITAGSLGVFTMGVDTSSFSASVSSFFSQFLQA